jgi:hypothetical protein
MQDISEGKFIFFADTEFDITNPNSIDRRATQYPHSMSSYGLEVMEITRMKGNVDCSTRIQPKGALIMSH